MNELSITHCRPRSILKNTYLCNKCLSPRQKLPFPQTPHDEIFLRSRHVRMQHTHISSQQHHVHKASHSIKQRTSSIQVSNQECICTIQYLQMSRIGHLSEHIFIVTLIFKACIPDQRGNQHALFYTGDPYLFLFSFFSFYHSHSIITVSPSSSPSTEHC